MLSSNRLDTLQKIPVSLAVRSHQSNPSAFRAHLVRLFFSALASGNDLVVSRFHRLSFSAGAAK